MTSEGTLRSPLDKPLGELTEEDISQLTREDCRRYLKEKGMRRPSWNKSQAIQQVLSLKSLLESCPRKEDIDSRNRLPKASSADYGVPCRMDNAGEDPVNVSEGSRSGSAGEGSVPPDLETPATAPEPEPSRRLPESCPGREGHNVERPGVAGDAGSRLATREPPEDFPKSSTSKEKTGQMTIFYDGKVHVYDGVSPEKARAIMLLAASPNLTLQIGEPRALHFPPRRVWGPSSPPTPNSSPTDGRKTRKESVQRFLEKRKDRGRMKAVCGSRKFSSSPLEVYLSQQMRDSNRTLSPSNTLTLPMPPPTPRRSGDGQPVFAADLNEDGIQEVDT